MAKGRGRPRRRAAVIVGPSDRRFHGIVGALSRNACGVSVYAPRRELPPVEGVNVRYSVLAGPVVFANGKRQVIARTDRLGSAAVDLRFRRRGAAVVGAAIVGGDGETVLYAGVSEGVPDAIALSAPALVAAGSSFEVEIRVRDHTGKPAGQASLELLARFGIDETVRGSIRRSRRGTYRGRLRLDQAGTWQIVCYDRATRVMGSAPVVVQPGAAAGFACVASLHATPRPRNEAKLRVRLVDACGNVLDPAGVHARVGKRRLERQIAAGEVQFTLRYEGNGAVEVALRDDASRLARRETVSFPAARFGSPGLIWAGSVFRTPLCIFPDAGEPAGGASVSVRFDPTQVSFEGFTPARGVPAVATLRGRDRIVVATEGLGRGARDAIGGVALGTCAWRCKREGEACFTLTARMSPEKASFTSCETQKRNHPTKLCLNFIYPETDPNAAAIKKNCEEMAKKVVEVFSSAASVTACCPVLDLCVHFSPLTADDWKKIGAALGGAAEIKDIGRDLGTVEGLNLRQKRPGCFNMYMIEFHEPAGVGPHAGVTDLGPMPRQAALDWRGNPLNCPHELGHALMGGDHSADRDNVMWHGGGGSKVDKDQCKKIFENIDKYGQC